MHILWIHQYFATPAGWGSVRTYETARRWVRDGHAVDVLCTAAYDATLAGGTPRGGSGRPCPGVDGALRLFVSRTPYSPHMGFWRRLSAFLGFTIFALRHVVRRGRRYDAIVASSAPLAVALPALAARALWRRPYLFEVIDVWPDAAIAAGVLRNPLLRALAFALEARAYRHAARIVTCSTGMTARLLNKGVPSGKVATCPNGCDLEAFAPDADVRRRVRAALGVEAGQLVALYTGAMGRSNAIDDVVATVHQTRADPRIVWWFAGDGSEAWKLRELERPSGGRVRFLGKIARQELPDYVRAADVALVTFMHAPLFHENSPNKFFDAIAAGLPVLFNRSTWLEPWLERYGNAIVCRDDPPAPALVAGLRDLAGDPARRERMGAASRRLACEVFDRERLAQQYLAVLEACLT